MAEPTPAADLPPGDPLDGNPGSADRESTAPVVVRYFAAAEEAAGTGEETVATDTTTVAELLADAVARRPRLADVVPSCSFLLDAVSVDRAATVTPGAVLDVLPPFAGG